MSIQRRRIYLDEEVNRIVRASERRTSTTGHLGHTGERHVLISNLDLATRGDAFLRSQRNDTPIVCAFIGTPEAVKTVTEGLNSSEGQDALGYLDTSAQRGDRVRLEARVTPFVARYSSGMGIVRKAEITSVRIILERIDEVAYHGLHIHTAFPILWFHRGGPAWLDSQNNWH